MWSFRGPTLGWALTLFYNTSPRISRLATPFVDGTAGSAAATADCTAGSRPFPGRNLDAYPWHCHCDIMKIEFNSDFFGFISHHIDTIDRNPKKSNGISSQPLETSKRTPFFAMSKRSRRSVHPHPLTQRWGQCAQQRPQHCTAQMVKAAGLCMRDTLLIATTLLILLTDIGRYWKVMKDVVQNPLQMLADSKFGYPQSAILFIRILSAATVTHLFLGIKLNQFHFEKRTCLQYIFFTDCIMEICQVVFTWTFASTAEIIGGTAVSSSKFMVIGPLHQVVVDVRSWKVNLFNDTQPYVVATAS